MDVSPILAALGYTEPVPEVTQFRAEEDGRPYEVWKVGNKVLKKTSPEEKQVYETFLSAGGPGPKVYAFGEYAGQLYMLMEYVSGTSMSIVTRQRLQRTLDVLIESQKKYWGDTVHTDAGYSFAKSWPNRVKRLAFMGDLQDAYQAYLDVFASVPRTLCNDDMLPFNVLADDDRAVIIDWEYAGILPYPCALARFLAFGEENPEEMFYMTAEDKAFALDYYYRNLVAEKGISREEFDRAMELFFFKEYSEWIYCDAICDEEVEYVRKYGPMARELAKKLGF